MNEGTTNLREQLRNLIEALLSLVPSRNLISQLIMLLPQDEDTLRSMYPELADRNFRDFLKVGVGLSYYDGRVEYSGSSLSGVLRHFISQVFDVLNRPDVRAALSALTGITVPNVGEEWVRTRLETVSEEVGEDVVRRTLKALIAAGYDYKSFEELRNATSLDEETLRKALLMMETYKLIEKPSNEDKYRLTSDARSYMEFISEFVGRGEAHETGG